jgi:hypothetical protein
MIDPPSFLRVVIFDSLSKACLSLQPVMYFKFAAFGFCACLWHALFLGDEDLSFY